MGSQELMSRKYSRRFDVFDSNADGLIQESDFLDVATRLARRFLRANSFDVDQLRDRYQALWRSLVFAHGQPPGSTITRVQFVEVCAAEDLLGFRHRACLTDRTAIDLCGIDLGYFFTADEAVDVFIAMGVHPGEAPEVRAELIRHARGPMSVAGVCRLLRTFYTSQDPAAPGNRIFGRLPSDHLHESIAITNVPSSASSPS